MPSSNFPPISPAAIQAAGPSALDGANTSRGTRSHDCKDGTLCATRYAPWADGPAFSALPEAPRGALVSARTCTKDSGYAEAFEQAINKGGGVFTHSLRWHGPPGDDVLIVLPAQQVMVVIPH